MVLITFFLHRMSARELGAAISESSKTLLGAGFVLIFTIPMVRILINSGRERLRHGVHAGGHGAAGGQQRG